MTLGIAAFNEDTSSLLEREHIRLLMPQIAAYSAAPPFLVNAARSEVFAQLLLIHEHIRSSAATLELCTHGATGEYPIVSTNPSYSLGGLSEDQGFEISYEDAVSLGRRLAAAIPSEVGDVDLEY